jgi:hypothetical protein
MLINKGHVVNQRQRMDHEVYGLLLYLDKVLGMT